jgi:phosphatidylserine/phosphatidylglycerophosphate/cardiolipin synthase-like enzyme
LHSKTAVIDDVALIGSANLTENAGTGTCEASLVTDDAQVVALVQGFELLGRFRTVELLKLTG